MIDPSERADTISAAIHNYRVGEFGEIRTRAILAMCGLNAVEMDELILPIRAEAFIAWRNYKREPVK